MLLDVLFADVGRHPVEERLVVDALLDDQPVHVTLHLLGRQVLAHRARRLYRTRRVLQLL